MDDIITNNDLKISDYNGNIVKWNIKSPKDKTPTILNNVHIDRNTLTPISSPSASDVSNSNIMDEILVDVNNLPKVGSYNIVSPISSPKSNGPDNRLLSKINKQKQQIDTLNNNLEKYKKKIEELNNKHTENINNLKKSYNNKISKLDNNNKLLEDEYNDKIKKLTNEIDNVKNELNDKHTQIEDYDKTIQQLNINIKNHDNRVSEIENKYKDEIEKLNEKIKNNDMVDENTKELNSILEKIKNEKDNMMIQLESLQQDYDEKIKISEQYKEDIKKLEIDKSKLIDSYNEKINDEKTKLSNKITKLKNDKNQLVQNYENDKKILIENYENEIELYKKTSDKDIDNKIDDKFNKIIQLFQQERDYNNRKIDRLIETINENKQSEHIATKVNNTVSKMVIKTPDGFIKHAYVNSDGKIIKTEPINDNYITTPNINDPYKKYILSDNSISPLQESIERRRIQEYNNMINTHPRYENMNYNERNRYFTKFQIKFNTLADCFPHMKIQLPLPDEDLHLVHTRYDELVHSVNIEQSLVKWRFGLVVSWLLIDAICIYFNMPAEFTAKEKQKIGQYNFILRKMCEKYYSSTAVEWSVESQLLILTGTSVLMYIITALLMKFLGGTYGSTIGGIMDAMSQQFIGNYMSQSNVDEDGIQEPIRQQPVLNGLEGLLANAAPNVMNFAKNLFGNNTNNKKRKGPVTAQANPTNNAEKH